MASINGVSSSNASSIYGNRNVFSGLASGMDTESMIENAISGYQAKITGLQQSKTKTEWKMEAYRNLTDQMVQFTRKYTSYTSATNLMSASFFSKAVLTSALGNHKDLISATGKSNSDVRINAVKQLASAARYAATGGVISQNDYSIQAGEGVDLTQVKELSNISGNLTIAYGGKNSVSLTFGEDEIFKDVKDEHGNVTKSAAQALAEAINQKLSEQTITTSSQTGKASEYIQATVKDGNVVLEHGAKGDSGNSLYISSASNNIQKNLGFFAGEEDKPTVLRVLPERLVNTDQTNADFISGQKMTVNFNGISKSITMPEIKTETDADGNQTFSINGQAVAADELNAKYVEALNTSLREAFGADKIEVANVGGDKLQLQFTIKDGDKGDTLSISSAANATLGMGYTETTYLNTSKTLGDLLGGAALKFDNEANWIKASGSVDDFKSVKDSAGRELYKTDSQGYRVELHDDGTYYRVDTNDPTAHLVSMEINGKEIGQYSKNTALETVMVDINNNADAGVKVSYSKLTGEMVFTAKETGSAGRIEVNSRLSGGGNNLAADLFGVIGSQNAPDANGNVYLKNAAGDFVDKDGNVTTDDSKKVVIGKYDAGKDAVVSVSVNDTEMTITRSSNNFDLDGLSVTLKGTFNEDAVTQSGSKWETNLDAIAANDRVTFKTESDADKIVDAVKTMIEDYNKMVTSIKEAYSTMPNYKYKNSGQRYEPLTDEDMSGMSESAIEAYNEKAKQGILFGDTDLSSMYNKLRNVFSPPGSDGSYLRSIGITTNYSSGLTTVELDEGKLRDALAANPDGVMNAFTKTQGVGGATTNGIMQGLKGTLDAYSSTDGAYKGVLINKAGSKYAALSVLDNSLQKSLDNIEDQITKWQGKMADKVDYYTRKFSALEQLVAQMNSQSSSLMSMMGGGM